MAKRDQQGESMDVKADADSRSVWVAARIDSLMPDHRMVTLEHEAIPDWQWPTMTMDFTVAEAVDMDALKQGMRLHVQITNNNSGGYQITQVHIPNEQGNDAMPAGMDHGQHEGMDHGQHEGMDHGDMSMPEHSEHQGMNHGGHDQKEHNHD